MTIAAQKPIQWHGHMALGYGPIDDAHAQFEELVSALLDASDESLGAALDAFALHACEHFAQEDTWMKETGFPAKRCHMAEHAAVLATVSGVQWRVAGGDVEAGRRLAAELQSWLPGHTQHLDSALVHWVCRERLGGKPIVLRRRRAGPAAQG